MDADGNVISPAAGITASQVAAAARTGIVRGKCRVYCMIACYAGKGVATDCALIYTVDHLRC